jgi:hypothetical protein
MVAECFLLKYKCKKAAKLTSAALITFIAFLQNGLL